MKMDIKVWVIVGIARISSNSVALARAHYYQLVIGGLIFFKNAYFSSNSLFCNTNHRPISVAQCSVGSIQWLGSLLGANTFTLTLKVCLALMLLWSNISCPHTIHKVVVRFWTDLFGRHLAWTSCSLVEFLIFYYIFIASCVKLSLDFCRLSTKWVQQAAMWTSGCTVSIVPKRPGFRSLI